MHVSRSTKSVGFFHAQQTLPFMVCFYHGGREQSVPQTEMGETLDIVLAVCLSSLVAGRSEDVRSTAWYRDLLFFSLSTDNKEEQLVNERAFRNSKK